MPISSIAYDQSNKIALDVLSSRFWGHKTSIKQLKPKMVSKVLEEKPLFFEVFETDLSNFNLEWLTVFVWADSDTSDLKNLLGWTVLSVFNTDLNYDSSTVKPKAVQFADAVQHFESLVQGLIARQTLAKFATES